jgi:hypothetical protein
MKKLFTLILLLVCTCLSTHAQFMGLRGGFSLSSITSNLNSSYSKIESNPLKGFQVGIVVEVPLSTTIKWLTMETGLMIQSKGSDLKWTEYFSTNPLRPSSQISYSWGTVISNFTGKTYLYYFDIPLNVKMYFSARKTSMYYEIGPYVGIGLSGKQHDNGQIREISWGPSSDSDYKQFDSGISMGLGVKIRSILIGLSYDLGLTNIDPSGSRIAHTRVFSAYIELMIHHKDKSSK